MQIDRRIERKQLTLAGKPHPSSRNFPPIVFTASTHSESGELHMGPDGHRIQIVSRVQSKDPQH